MPGDRADSVYVLKKGRIKLSVLSESGKEIAIDIIQPGEMFGEFALIDESVRSNMTQALDDVAILVFNKRDFVNLLKSQSDTCFELHPNGRRSPPADGEETLGHYF